MTQSRKNFLWNTLGNVFYLAIQWLITVLTARFYGYGDAGVLSLAMSISATFQMIAYFGIRNFQISDIDNKYEDSCYIGLRGITCIISEIACVIFLFLNHYNAQQFWTIIWFMLFRLSESYSEVFHGVAQKYGRLDIAGKLFALKGFFIFLAFISSYLLGADMCVNIFIIAIISCTLTVLVDIMWIRKITSLHFFYNIKKCILLGLKTLPLCVYLFMNSTISTVPKYFLERICDETVLGAYSSIFAPAVILQAAALYVYTPFIPSFAEKYADNDSKGFIDLACKIIAVLVLLIIAAIIVAALCGDFVLSLVFGETILDFTYLLIPTIVATFFIAFSSFVCMLETVTRDFKNLIIGNVISFVGTTISSFFLINSIGPNGASYGMMIGALTGIAYMSFAIMINLNRKNSATHLT